MSTPPNQKLRSAVNAITFAHRLSSASERRDEAVIEAVNKVSPEFRDKPPRRPSAPLGVYKCVARKD